MLVIYKPCTSLIPTWIFILALYLASRLTALSASSRNLLAIQCSERTIWSVFQNCFLEHMRTPCHSSSLRNLFRVYDYPSKAYEELSGASGVPKRTGPDGRLGNSHVAPQLASRRQFPVASYSMATRHPKNIRFFKILLTAFGNFA